MHTDPGRAYASHDYRRLMHSYRMVQSMSRRANCWNSEAMASFFKTMKVEQVHQLRYNTRAAARLDIARWIEGLFNHRRIHSSIGFRTLVDAEASLRAAQCCVRGTRARTNLYFPFFSPRQLELHAPYYATSFPGKRAEKCTTQEFRGPKEADRERLGASRRGPSSSGNGLFNKNATSKRDYWRVTDSDILIAVTDRLKGIGEALGAVFAATTLQTCIVHTAGRTRRGSSAALDPRRP